MFRVLRLSQDLGPVLMRGCSRASWPPAVEISLTADAKRSVMIRPSYAASPIHVRETRGVAHSLPKRHLKGRSVPRHVTDLVRRHGYSVNWTSGTLYRAWTVSDVGSPPAHGSPKRYKGMSDDVCRGRCTSRSHLVGERRPEDQRSNVCRSPCTVLSVLQRCFVSTLQLSRVTRKTARGSTTYRVGGKVTKTRLG
jgi:hypothetical protein